MCRQHKGETAGTKRRCFRRADRYRTAAGEVNDKKHDRSGVFPENLTRTREFLREPILRVRTLSIRRCTHARTHTRARTYNI